MIICIPSVAVSAVMFPIKINERWRPQWHPLCHQPTHRLQVAVWWQLRLPWPMTDASSMAISYNIVFIHLCRSKNAYGRPNLLV